MINNTKIQKKKYKNACLLLHHHIGDTLVTTHKFLLAHSVDAKIDHVCPIYELAGHFIKDMGQKN